MTDQQTLIECAAKAVQIFAEQHPRPSQVTQVQAGQMLGLSAQTICKMVRQGRLSLNGLGMIPISEIDRALLVK